MLASSVQAVVACNANVPRVCTLVLFILSCVGHRRVAMYVQDVHTCTCICYDLKLLAWHPVGSTPCSQLKVAEP